MKFFWKNQGLLSAPRLAALAFLAIGPFTAQADDAPSNPPALEWSIDNPFPFIRDAKSTEGLQAALLKIKEDGSGFEVYAKAVSDVYKSRTAWIPEKGTSGGHYDSALIHSTILNIHAAIPSLLSASCQWKGVEHQPPGPCATPQSIVIDTSSDDNLTVDVFDGSAKRTFSYTIKPEEQVIIGMGDSFSSGEGNPDREESWQVNKIRSVDRSSPLRMWPLYYRPTSAEQADWNDVKCHRSLYSWQFLYALKRSTEDPHRHRLVRFASFSCSGAEIYDGLLTRQIISDKKHHTKDEDFKAKTSQLDAAVMLLCEGHTKPDPASIHYHLVAETNVKIAPLTCQGKMTNPTEVLLTIGGNDIGFAGLIGWSSFPGKGYIWLTTKTSVWLINKLMMSQHGIICPEHTTQNDSRCRGHHFVAEDAFQGDWLKENLLFAQNTLASHLGIPMSRIHQLTYPDPTVGFVEQNNFEMSKMASFAIRYKLFRALYPLFPINAILRLLALPISDPFLKRFVNSYKIGPEPIRVSAAEEIGKQLMSTIEGTAQDPSKGQNGIDVIDISAPFEGHGFSQAANEEQLHIPRLSAAWSPYSPELKDHSWMHSKRWFRTPNDALMTEYSDSIYNDSAWISGMFHPNNQAHFSMYSTLLAHMKSH